MTYKGGKITVGDLQDRMGMTLQHVLTSRHVSPDSFKAMIERLVDDTLKAREAERRGFGYDAEVLEATRREAVELFIREQFEAPKAGDSVSQEEVEKYYQEHLDEFHRPLSRRASQIVVRTRNQAATILREAGVLDMRRFRELVAKFSIDEDSKKRGGDLRYFDPKGRAVPLTSDHLEEDSVEPAVAQAVFALSGQQKVVPEPIQVSNGWAVVRMTAERPEYVYGFKRVAPQIRTRLLEKRKQARIDAHVAELRRKTVVEVHPELVDAIELEPPKK